ncbi:elongation factor P 5-aminopentanone reductase [Vagococcus bubulae]|uniref:3-oxoacyl-ACP reductase n=1 Tax=Vagococcus bubulae TaxID=1977868 RepID=A0A429ZPF7_9ENTE|nr:SDR family oxidoreductase [Vagococcus bubulae]RST95603.1 3-oxoacyl-ACP reductase [Vagococcus bubulae]
MKYVLVTGASGDIGEACVKQLAKKGYSVYCHYFRNEQKMKSLLSDLILQYPKQDFFALQADLSSPNSVEELIQNMFQLHAIVFAHGDTVYKLLSDTTPDEMTYLWLTHVYNPIRLCQLCQPKLTQHSHSQIVFISSVYGLIGSSMEVMYSTVKGAQIAFVKSYAKEVASMNLTVNAVAPGAVDTHMNALWSKEEKETLRSDIPLNRLAHPKEVASLVSYLLSSDASYMTGTTIPLTGGWSI